MGGIARDDRQITFYYNPESSVGRKSLAYIQESKVPVLTVNLLENNPTGSQWLEIASGLGIDIGDLILKDHPVFTQHYGEADLDAEGWLKVIQNHPEVVDQPIVIRGEKVVLVKVPTEILQVLDAEKEK